MMFNNSKKYKMQFICSNCDKKQNVNIKKGMKVSEFMVTKEAKCKCCGINSLHTYEDWVMKRKMWEQMMQQEVMNPQPTDLDYLK